MISQNDLYDITAALSLIRSDIENQTNGLIISAIEQVLKFNKQEFDDNQIRKAISSVKHLDKERWNYVYHNNVYVSHKFLKSEFVYLLLIKLCSKLQLLLEGKKIERAYDLVDCIHCLPEILADNNFLIPKSYWKSYVKLYRKKWDKEFLLSEERMSNKHNKNRNI